ncbi:conserved hypothetical protein [Deferribacter desulfuricans SSM1]|uniref:YggT family protein n=1 Tax=Deferribacter desulfuricans (strain DSM 14783 / JCM 11476 / NBRC 101012 / SSM1) TaxID=639282 RepID=D3PCZ5_DEFDS|nr:YggT family protein [Deferribacter desulfuricans]BAI80468.1 conserved hypothetical protein [Deferribacter desulfuricans SSM1]
MWFFSFIIKAYIVLLILRGVMTRQELYFNPLGKLVASFTEPIFATIFSKYPHEKSKKFIPLVIIIFTILLGLVYWAFNGVSFLYSLIGAVDEMLRFLMVFYIIALILGSLLNTSYQASIYTTFFHRIGLPVVKVTRSIINVPGNTVVVISVIFIFLIYVFLDSGLQILFNSLVGRGVDVVSVVLLTTKYGLFTLIGLLKILTWLVIIRALISWVSPDPYNPIVQLIVALTEPVMGPFRRLIPPIGMIDISPIVLIFVIEFLRVFLIRLLEIIF